ncbi:MAG: hypothetical protein KDB02_15950 [Acidimicrobiales bacterium]|nr:hypothetical protein [Acidimicrobiales bacterium]
MSPDAGRPGSGIPGRSHGGDLAGAGGGSVVLDRTGAHRQVTAKQYLSRQPMDVLASFLAGEPNPEQGLFWCIRCQNTPAKRIMHAPAARAVNGTDWACTGCGKTGTRFSLQNLILARPEALALVRVAIDEEARRG